jgi:hypothetical protein
MSISGRDFGRLALGGLSAMVGVPRVGGSAATASAQSAYPQTTAARQRHHALVENHSASEVANLVTYLQQAR